jgi:hypothetical protein
MSDKLPGWTCPDIDAVVKTIKKAKKRLNSTEKDENIIGELDHALLILEELRASNIQLRTRCKELLNEKKQ